MHLYDRSRELANAYWEWSVDEWHHAENLQIAIPVLFGCLYVVYAILAYHLRQNEKRAEIIAKRSLSKAARCKVDQVLKDKRFQSLVTSEVGKKDVRGGKGDETAETYTAQSLTDAEERSTHLMTPKLSTAPSQSNVLGFVPATAQISRSAWVKMRFQSQRRESRHVRGSLSSLWSTSRKFAEALRFQHSFISAFAASVYTSYTRPQRLTTLLALIAVAFALSSLCYARPSAIGINAILDIGNGDAVGDNENDNSLSTDSEKSDDSFVRQLFVATLTAAVLFALEPLLSFYFRRTPRNIRDCDRHYRRKRPNALALRSPSSSSVSPTDSGEETPPKSKSGVAFVRSQCCSEAPESPDSQVSNVHLSALKCESSMVSSTIDFASVSERSTASKAGRRNSASGESAAMNIILRQNSHSEIRKNDSLLSPKRRANPSLSPMTTANTSSSTNTSSTTSAPSLSPSSASPSPVHRSNSGGNQSAQIAAISANSYCWNNNSNSSNNVSNHSSNSSSSTTTPKYTQLEEIVRRLLASKTTELSDDEEEFVRPCGVAERDGDDDGGDGEKVRAAMTQALWTKGIHQVMKRRFVSASRNFLAANDDAKLLRGVDDARLWAFFYAIQRLGLRDSREFDANYAAELELLEATEAQDNDEKREEIGEFAVFRSMADRFPTAGNTLIVPDLFRSPTFATSNSHGNLLVGVNMNVSGRDRSPLRRSPRSPSVSALSHPHPHHAYHHSRSGSGAGSGSSRTFARHGGVVVAPPIAGSVVRNSRSRLHHHHHQGHSSRSHSRTPSPSLSLSLASRDRPAPLNLSLSPSASSSSALRTYSGLLMATKSSASSSLLPPVQRLQQSGGSFCGASRAELFLRELWVSNPGRKWGESERESESGVVGDGTKESPYRSIQCAVDVARPGDVIRILPGIYEPFGVFRSGTEERPIMIVAHDLPAPPLSLSAGNGGALSPAGSDSHMVTICLDDTVQNSPAISTTPDQSRVVIDGNIPGNDFEAVITIGDPKVHVNNVIVRGLTVQNGRIGVDMRYASDVRVEQNRLLEVSRGIAFPDEYDVNCTVGNVVSLLDEPPKPDGFWRRVRGKRSYDPIPVADRYGRDFWPHSYVLGMYVALHLLSVGALVVAVGYSNALEGDAIRAAWIVSCAIALLLEFTVNFVLRLALSSLAKRCVTRKRSNGFRGVV